MIKYNNAIRTARSLIGTPYGEMDCIRLIVMVIRRTAGGDADYRCEGTNWLWRSIDNSARYRHLTWRQESTGGAQAGMLAFKRDGDDVHHVGLVTERGTVIHSSSVKGMVVETALDGSWHLLGRHKLIEAGKSTQTDDGEREEQSPSPTRDENTYADDVQSILPEDSHVGAGFYSAQTADANAYTSLVREDGTGIVLMGRWRIADD